MMPEQKPGGWGIGPRAAGVAGSVLFAAAIAIGALGAHTLEGRIPAARLDTLETAVRYQVYGALGLLLIAVLGLQASAVERGSLRVGPLRAGAALLLAGVLVFALTLYGLVAGGPGILGAVTPIGGALMIAAWVVVAFAFTRR